MKTTILFLLVGLLVVVSACTPAANTETTQDDSDTSDSNGNGEVTELSDEESDVSDSDDKEVSDNLGVETPEEDSSSDDEGSSDSDEGEVAASGESDVSSNDNAADGWQSIVLTDVRSGEEFTVNDFDKPVLLETFAIWCPKCKSQQNNVKELHEMVGDAVVSIGVNVDPNEDEAMVLEYITSNGFDWKYVVAPQEFTQSIVDEFGVGVANAPSTPIVLVCPDKSATLLSSGLKDANTLKAAYEGCA